MFNTFAALLLVGTVLVAEPAVAQEITVWDLEVRRPSNKRTIMREAPRLSSRRHSRRNHQLCVMQPINITRCSAPGAVLQRRPDLSHERRRAGQARILALLKLNDKAADLRGRWSAGRNLPVPMAASMPFRCRSEGFVSLLQQEACMATPASTWGILRRPGPTLTKVCEAIKAKGSSCFADGQQGRLRRRICSRKWRRPMDGSAAAGFR